MSYTLKFYRDDQASDYATALKDGAVRTHTLDGESKHLLDGCAADAVALINKATDMMEHKALINYYLYNDDDDLVDTNDDNVKEFEKLQLQKEKKK